MTTQMLYLPSHLLYLTLFPLYLCHQTQCINYTTPTLCTTSHAFYVWHHIQYAWHHMNSLWHHTPLCMTSHPVYLWHHNQYIWYHPYCFHDSTTTIPVISPTIFEITATASVMSHLLYWWHHKYGSHHNWHTYDIMNTQHDITFSLWHQLSSFMTSQPLHSWHQISYIWHHIHDLWHFIPYTCDITATLSETSHPLCEYISTIYEIKHTVLRRYNHYIWPHTLHICIYVITPTLSEIQHTLYVWYHTYYMYGTICSIYEITPMLYDITALYSWYQI